MKLVATRVGLLAAVLAFSATTATLGCATASPDAEALKADARRDVAEGRPSAALRSLRFAAELAPADPEVFFLIGVVALRVERPQEALAALTRALELDPDDPQLLSFRGLALKALRRYDEAERELQRSLVFAPDDPSTLFALGDVYRLTGRAEKCVGSYSQGVQLLASRDRLDRKEARALRVAEDQMRSCDLARTQR